MLACVGYRFTGQEVNSVIWGTSVYVKDGDAWKWTFGINVPARAEGT
jgi:hypothetical protein